MAVLLMIGVYGDTCGVANFQAIEKGNTFAVVRRECAQGPQYSFGHELVHLYGCDHNREDANSKSEFGYGKQFLKGSRYNGYITIMR